MAKINGVSMAMARIEGVSPLLMRNGQLANPMNEWARQVKQITGKHHSKKTEADDIELMRLEFQGGLYFDDETGPYIPSVNVEGCIRDAAKTQRKGSAATAGLQVSPDNIKLLYSGPRDREGLYADKKFVDTRGVKLQKSTTIMRTRPRFDKWAIEFEIMTIDEVLNIGDIKDFLEVGGMLKGIGDFKPKFGRFVVKNFEIIK